VIFDVYDICIVEILKVFKIDLSGFYRDRRYGLKGLKLIWEQLEKLVFSAESGVSS
jgi:hypothetical protein